MGTTGAETVRFATSGDGQFVYYRRHKASKARAIDFEWSRRADSLYNGAGPISGGINELVFITFLAYRARGLIDMMIDGFAGYYTMTAAAHGD